MPQRLIWGCPENLGCGDEKVNGLVCDRKGQAFTPDPDGNPPARSSVASGMRRIVLLLLLALPLFATPFDVEANLGRLTDAQREWLAMFEAGARLHANADIPSSDWLWASAASARAVQLDETAKVLDAAANVLTNHMSLEDYEETFRATMNARIYIVLNVNEKRLTDVVVAIPNPSASRGLLPENLAEFERSLPGFVPTRFDTLPKDRSRIATLHFRAGKSVASTSPGSYLPFDTSLNAKVGRTWIVYDNMITASWFATRVLPVAEALMPFDINRVKADALLHWYAFRAPMYFIGSHLDERDLERFGEDKDALRIVKADVLSTLAAGAQDEDLATLLAVTFDTLQDSTTGKAPRAHRIASAMLLNRAVQRNAIRFRNDRWSVDLAAFRDVVREMAADVLEAEFLRSPLRGHALVQCYGAMTPELERTVQIIDALPKKTIEPRYALPSPDAVVRSYFAATTREDALAHLVPEYRKTVSEALKWDFALHPSHRIESIEVRDDTAIVNDVETNDFARLLDFPGWTATTTFHVFEGRIVSSSYAPALNQPRWQTYLEKALPWLRVMRPESLAHAYPNESLNREAAAEWVSMLRDWRAATGRPAL